MIAYKALPRPQFSSLQQKIFPVYFGMQTALPVVLALTYPGSKTSLGTPSGLGGTFAEGNRWSVLLPLATMFITSLANLAFIGPATTNIMKERKHQGIRSMSRIIRIWLIATILETRDGKKSYDPAPHSKEMQQLNKAFGKIHGVSSLLNMAGFIATMWYGIHLAERIQ